MKKDYYYGGGHSAGLTSCDSTAEEISVTNGYCLNVHFSESGPDAREFSLGYIFYIQVIEDNYSA